jgi:hypothetical protein
VRATLARFQAPADAPARGGELDDLLRRFNDLVAGYNQTRI